MTGEHPRPDRTNYDVVVVGGGAAGLSGALMLGRARRSVLVVDSGQPRNAPAAHVHGFLSRDGAPPGEFLEAGRREVRHYGGEILTGRATSVARLADGFAVEVDHGRTVAARRLLMATGTTDELPEVAGIESRWGRDVLHCPYCHGWEFRDQAVGVLATGPKAMHQALLFRQWTADLTLFSHTTTPPTGEEAEQLAARGIAVVPGEVASLEITDDRLTGVRLSGGEPFPLRALLVAPRLTARSGVLTSLGVEVTASPDGLFEHVATDRTGRTEVPGVWVAGNTADPLAQVVGAAASGAGAGAAINADLISEDTRDAVTARRAASAPDSRACDGENTPAQPRGR